MAREGGFGCEWYQSIGLYISDKKKKFKEILLFYYRKTYALICN
jgi:hypothetical protein